MSAFSPRPQSFAERISGQQEVPAPAPSAEATDTAIYRPYGFLPIGTINETCDVQRWMDGTQTPEGLEFQYRFLLQIGYVGEELIKLFLPDCVVVIEGQNLRDLRKKLARRQITFIQQFSSKVWLSRPAVADAIVEQVCVLRSEKG